MPRNNVSWLLSTPADDCNFKAALGYATGAELKEAEETLDLQLRVGFRVKSRLLTVRREIRRRGREKNERGIDGRKDVKRMA